MKQIKWSPEALLVADRQARFPWVFHLIESNEQSLKVCSHIERDCRGSKKKNNLFFQIFLTCLRGVKVEKDFDSGAWI